MLNYAFSFLFFVFLAAGPADADVVIVPPDMGKIIARIEARQDVKTLPPVPGKFVEKDGHIIFSKPLDITSSVSFVQGSPAIVRHFQLKGNNDAYAFQIALDHDGAYQHVVEKVNGAEALFFFNDAEVFIYTQTAGEDGGVELKEWIYALKPNSSGGSQWSWIMKSEPWQWPLTVEMDERGGAVINRHLPFKGIPIVDKARSQYMLDVMIKFKKGEPVKKYFPFSEPVVAIPPARFWTKEGVVRSADAQVTNASVDDPNRPMPKVGLDFNRWDEHWHTAYKINVSAKPDEYPLLVE